MTSTPSPVVFIHGLWPHPSSWDPWIELFEAAAADFSPHSPAKVDTASDQSGPLLLVKGGEDHTVPEAVTKSTLKQYRGSQAETDIMELGDRGHSLTIDTAGAR